MLSIFSCACCPYVCLFGGNVYLGFLPIFDWVGFFFFWRWIYELFVYFGHQSLVGCMVWEYFIPFDRLSFCFLVVSFALQKLIRLIKSHLFIFPFISLALGDLRKYCMVYVKECFAYVLFQEFYGIMSYF